MKVRKFTTEWFSFSSSASFAPSAVNPEIVSARITLEAEKGLIAECFLLK